MAADRASPPKQRHTAKRIFECLRAEHGFAGGYTIIKDYLREQHARTQEVFVPLALSGGSMEPDLYGHIGNRNQGAGKNLRKTHWVEHFGHHVLSALPGCDMRWAAFETDIHT